MKNIKLLFLLTIFAISSATATEDNRPLKAYVQKLLQEGYDMFHNPDLTAEDKKRGSAEIIRAHLYLDWMARHSLGRYRRTLPEAKIEEFVKIYSDFIVKAYSELANNYSGEKAVFTNIRAVDHDLFIVSTEILKPDSQGAVKVDYLVHKLQNNKKTPYLVGDIITEGISILNSQQTEFNSVISARGIDYLIEDLRKRTNRVK